MKTSIWDILTGVILLGILCMIGTISLILFNPGTPLNPLRPNGGAQVITPIHLPTATPTLPGLPPTWTPPPPLAQEATQVVDAASVTLSPSGLRPSATPIPTNTFVVLPSFTPSKVPRTGVSGGTCLITSQDPADNSVQTKDKDFPVTWTIKNTSKDSWPAGDVDIRYNSGGGGNHVHTSADVMDMPGDVPSGGSFSLKITMHAPADPGSYVSNWQIVNGSKSVCSFFVSFRVLP